GEERLVGQRDFDFVQQGLRVLGRRRDLQSPGFETFLATRFISGRIDREYHVFAQRLDRGRRPLDLAHQCVVADSLGERQLDLRLSGAKAVSRLVLGGLFVTRGVVRGCRLVGGFFIGGAFADGVLRGGLFAGGRGILPGGGLIAVGQRQQQLVRFEPRRPIVLVRFGLGLLFGRRRFAGGFFLRSRGRRDWLDFFERQAVEGQLALEHALQFVFDPFDVGLRSFGRRVRLVDVRLRGD